MGFSSKKKVLDRKQKRSEKMVMEKYIEEFTQCVFYFRAEDDT